jgi:hypothetical protein
MCGPLSTRLQRGAYYGHTPGHHSRTKFQTPVQSFRATQNERGLAQSNPVAEQTVSAKGSYPILPGQRGSSHVIASCLESVSPLAKYFC